jgi:hypothetical protein
MLMPDDDMKIIFNLIPVEGAIDLETLSHLAGRSVSDLAPLILFGLKTGCLALVHGAAERQDFGTV